MAVIQQFQHILYTHLDRITQVEDMAEFQTSCHGLLHYVIHSRTRSTYKINHTWAQCGNDPRKLP